MTSYCVQAQLPYTENFDSDGDPNRYTTNTSSLGTFTGTHYFFRTTDNPVKYPASTGIVTFGTTANPSTIYSSQGVPATPGFWACEGVRGSSSSGDTYTVGVVELNSINVANYTNLTVSLKLADARGLGYTAATPTAEYDDKIRIEYLMDGGTWQTVGLFMGEANSGPGYWRQADPNAEVPMSSGYTLSNTFQSFSYSIPAVGNRLRVRVVLDQRGSGEEIAFDDITVTGTPSTPAPTVANIESTSLPYNVGAPATPITSSITVSGSVTNARVSISSGFQSNQDKLSFTDPNGVITGVFDTFTGVMTLSGTATAAQYQAALRLVQYENTLTTTATLGTRTIYFYVFNSGGTNTVSRNVSVSNCTTSVSSPISQTVNANTSVSFNVSAVGGQNVTYQWQQSTDGGSSFSNLANQTNASLSLTASSAMNGYRYRVVASSSGCTSLTSSAATLTVQDCPASVSSPASQTVNANTSASFIVSVTGGQSPTYQWQQSTDNGATFSNLANQTSASLSLANVSSTQNGYRYRVVVSSSGCTSLTSSVATLTVRTCPDMVNGPSDQTVNAGGSVFFSPVYSPPSPNFTYQWQQSTDNGTSFSNLANQTSVSLSLVNVSSTQNGYRYRVVVSNTGCTPVTSSAATLTVRDCPQGPVSVSDQTVNAGSSAFFSVLPSMSPSYTYQWQQSSDGGTNFTNVSSGGTNSSLSLNSVTASMNGYKYRVVVSATGCTPVTSSVATLTVQNCPTSVSNPVSQTVNTSTSVSFNVSVTGGQNLMYQWQRSTDNGANFTNIDGETNASLSLTASAAMNGYRYRVVVSSSGCKPVISSAATLTVQDCPTNLTGPASQTVNTSSSANFIVTVSGGANLTYQWQQSTDAGASFSDLANQTSASLNLANVSSTMNGYRYRVLVSSSGCSSLTSSAATLTVRECLSSSNVTGPMDQTVRAGETMRIEVTISSGSPVNGLSYQWQQSTDNGATFTDIPSQTDPLFAQPTSLSMSGYRYRVVISPPGCSTITSSTATLTVLAPCPSTVSGVNSQTVSAGKSVTFVASVSPLTAGLTYQWQQSNDGGVSFYNMQGETNSSLTFPVDINFNEFRYRVVVSSPGCSPITSSTATLTVRDCPLNIQPIDNQTVDDGDYAYFFGYSDGSNLTYQWQQSTDRGTTFTNLAGQTNDYLDFTAYANMNGYQYRVVVSSPDCDPITSSAATLTVRNCPDYVDIYSEQVNAGGEVFFDADVQGGANLTYQWQESTNGGTSFSDIQGRTRSSLSFTAYAYMNGYQYRVVVSSPDCDPITSSAATLTVRDCPTYADVYSEQVNANDPVTFNAYADGGSNLTYQWQRSTNNGASFTNLSGEKSSQLSFIASANMNGYRYRVVVSGPGCDDVTSSAATLTVDDCITHIEGPGNQMVDPNQTATFSVTVTGGQNLTYQWKQSTDGGGTFTDIAGQTNPSLNVTASLSMNGYLYQVIVNASGCPEYASPVALLEVRNCPTSISGISSQTVNQGDNFTLTANVTGGAPTYYLWQQSTDGGVSFNDMPPPRTASRSFTATAEMNGYQYRVVVLSPNCPPFTSPVATLTVQDCPTSVSSPASQTVDANTSASFSVSVTGGQNLTYQWQQSTDGVYFFPMDGETSSTLSLTAFEKMSGNQYRVVVSSTGCTSLTSSAATLTVQAVCPMPSITTQPPASSVVCAGTPVTVSAGINENGNTGGITYQWYKNDGVLAGATTTTLSLTNAQSSDAGEYKLVITSNCGSLTSSAFNLSVMPTPTASLVASNILTCSVTSATLTATGGSTYAFSGPGVVSSDATSGTAVVNVAGTYSVTATTGSCTSTTTVAVLGDQTAPTVSLANDGPLSCAQPTVTLTATGSYAPDNVRPDGSLRQMAPVSFTYVFSGGATPSGDGSTASVNTAGVYSVTVTGQNGCSRVASTTVTGNPSPTLITASPANVTVTAGQTATFELAGNTTGLSYQWQLNAGSGFTNLTNDATYSGVTSATLSVANTTTALSGYQYRAVVTSGVCSATSNSAMLTVNPVPQPDLAMLLYTLPTLVYGTTPVSMVMDVTEIQRAPTSGLITIKIAVDAVLTLTLPRNVAIVGGRPVNNSGWTLTGPTDGFYTLTTNQSIAAGDVLSVGLTGVLKPGATRGSLSITAVLVGGSGGEIRIDNNSDADKIDYFNK